MILKFDHISYSCEYVNEQEILKKFSEYHEVFFEKELENISAKKQFMHNFTEKHNIRMLNNEFFLPIEITSYEKCGFENNNLYLNEDKTEIIIRTNNLEETYQFLFVLNAKKEIVSETEWIITIKPLLDKKTLVIRLLKTEKEIISKLDYNGYGSLCFFVDKVKSYQQKYKEKGYSVSEAETLTVNQNELNIFFVEGYHGEIIEIIGVK